LIASSASHRRTVDGVEDDGDVTLIALPGWLGETSAVLWYGDRWCCLIDVWTGEGG
jgi:hypothetical protein